MEHVDIIEIGLKENLLSDEDMVKFIQNSIKEINISLLVKVLVYYEQIDLIEKVFNLVKRTEVILDSLLYSI